MKINTRKSFIKLLGGGCAVAALMASGAALAQAPQAAGASEGAIEEIVVTAQRRTERLENVPMAVAALSAAALERAQVVNIHEIGAITPGVQIGFGGVSTIPSIRGISSLTNGTGNENNIAIYVDGFYVSDNQSINQDLANLQGIQVLKGPQGTLYGRNATGGAILVQTLDPTDELSGKFEGSYGKFSERKLSGYISGPLSDKVGFMVAGGYRNSDGWIKKSLPGRPSQFSGKANPQKQRSLRTKLKAELSDTLTATAAYNYSLASDPSGLMFTNFQFVSPLVAGLNNACCFGVSSQNEKQIASGENNQATLTVEWETGIGTLTSRTGYDRRKTVTLFDFDGSYNLLSFSDSRVRFKAFQQGLDYNITAIDNVDLVVGGFYFDEKTNIKSVAFGYPGGVRSVSTIGTRDLQTKAWAAYADVTFHATDRLAIGVGGRYSHDKKSQGWRNFAVVAANNFLAPNTSFTSSKFTPRATIRYEVADRTNVYATWSRGFRAASYNAGVSSVASAILPIKAETITSYEVGFKTAQRTFRAEIAAFYYDYKNLNTSLTVQNPLNPLQPTLIVGNAPKAKVKGIEGQIVAQPFERFNVTLGAAYIHARYGRFPNAIGNGLNTLTNLNLTGQVQDWTGIQMARAPDFTANLAIDYTVPVADGSLRLSGNVKYTDSFVVNNPSLWDRSALTCPAFPAAGAAAATPAGVFSARCPQVPANLLGKQRYRQGAYTMVDGDITWYAEGERYWVGVYGKNLTNKSYKRAFNGNVFGDYATKGAPISYGVKVGYKFGAR